MSDEKEHDNVRPIERAKSAATETVERGRAAAREGLDSAREGLDSAREAARERYDDTVVQLREGYEQVRDNFEATADDLSDYVRRNPGKSVLAAAFAGFLLGLLFRGGDD